jgi:hypothetical protein
MPLRTIIARSSIAGLLLLLAAPMQAQTGDAHSPASLARVRAALDEPPPILWVPTSGVIPTFRVEVQQPFWNLDPVEEGASDPTMGLPSAGELLMGGIGKIGSAVAGHKRTRAKRRARKEVDEALSAFCAVHECPVPGTGKH